MFFTQMTEKSFVFDSPSPNDKIDIHGDIDVHLKKIPTDNPLEMRMLIKGRNIDHSIVNAIRRTILRSIPIYGFHRSNIFIDNEKTRYMYNNDLVYNQIETLPIYDIQNNFDLEDPETYLTNEVMKNLFGNFVQQKFVGDASKNHQTPDTHKKLLKIELSLNLKNNTSSDKFVSTHDCLLRINGKVSNSYQSRDPISILVLKPTEEISLRAEANLGISVMSASYEATTNAYYIMKNGTSYELCYETLGQLDKDIIFTKACIIIFKKLENLSKYIKDKFQEERDTSEPIDIELYGEDHTLGNLLATALQKCQYTVSAGYTMPHPLMNMIIIRYKLQARSKLGPIQVLIETINYLIKLFQKIAN